MFAVLLGGLVFVNAAILSFVLAFVDPLPAGLWIAFGIVVVISVGLAGAAWLLVFRSDQPSVDTTLRTITAPGGVRRILVVADATIGSEAFRRTVWGQATGSKSEVLVVTPALNTPIRHWTDEEDAARAEARLRLDEELDVLAALGVEARGEVGADDPLQALDDALRIFPADEIIVVTGREEASNWLEEGLVAQARTSGLPVTHVTAA